MKFKAIATAGVIASLSFAPAETAYADAGDAIAGAIIGGILGHAIANDQNRRKSTQRRSSKSTKSAKPGISSAQREQNREVQVALNHFGYPVGAPDGSIGPKSRAAISSLQVTLGYPPTGQLSDYERTLLVGAYQRAIYGGPQVAQVAASHPMGIKGLLLMQRDEMAGIPGTQPAAPQVVAVQPVAPQPVAPVAAGAVMAGAGALPSLMPETQDAAAPALTPALPSFMGTGVAQVSLASQCNKISLMTNTNGGYVTAATMTDATFALGEQFCLARTYAMATGEEMAAKVAGFTPAQIADQCAGFGPVLASHVAALSVKTRDEVLAGVSSFITQSGMSPAQLSGTAKVCLGVGYTTDNMDVAVGSALLLSAMGEAGYAELMGHHLAQGFGTAVRPDLALDWYQMGLDAMGQGGAVFAPGLNDRPEVIRKAAFTIAGRAGEVAPVVPAALPQFALVPEAAAVPEAVAVAPAAVAQAAPVAVAAAPVVAAPAQGAAAIPTPEAAGGRALLSAAKLPFLLLGN